MIALSKTSLNEQQARNVGSAVNAAMAASGSDQRVGAGVAFTPTDGSETRHQASFSNQPTRTHGNSIPVDANGSKRARTLPVLNPEIIKSIDGIAGVSGISCSCHCLFFVS